MSDLRIRSLRGKVVLFVTGVIALCGVLSVAIISRVVSDQLAAQYELDQETSVEFLSTSLVPMLELKDYVRVEHTIESVLVYENIVSVAVYDAEGALIRSVTELGEEATEADIITHVMMLDEEAKGRVEIGFSRLYIERQVDDLTRALTAAITAFLAVTAAALLWYLGRSIVGPLRTFTDTVRTMSSTNLSVRLPVTGPDEIGILAHSFNTVARELQESQRQLEEAHIHLQERFRARAEREQRRTEQVRRIFEMRRRINSMGSLEELLHYVTVSLQETFNYYSVNVFLVEQPSGELKLAAGAGGYTDTPPVGRTLQPGDGIVGQVLQSCQPRLVSDVAHEPRYIADPELQDTRAELAVPINIGALTLGVLDIQSARDNSLDEMDLFTAQAVADQLANVIENARLAEETRDLAILDERNRMAREIHDTLAQGFTGIVLQLEAAEQGLQEAPESAPSHIDRAKKLARDSLNEARRSVWALRPGALEKRDLVDSLRRETASLRGEGKVDAEFRVSGTIGRLPSEVEDALLRICQESLTNIRRHAAASRAEVELSFTNDSVTLRVRDDGAGFDPSLPHEGTFGLIGMSERAHQCGGSTLVSSEPGNGTLVQVTIPIERRHHRE
jgi:signal transduction histidine kinase/HAMP domain-containing protein